MDTKLKSKDKVNNNIITTIVIILIILASAIGMFSSYPIIKNVGAEGKTDYLESYELSEFLDESSYYLQFETSKHKEKGKKPSDIYCEESTIYENYEKRYSDNEFNLWGNRLRQTNNIKYFAYNKDTKKVVDNFDGLIKIEEDTNEINIENLDYKNFRTIIRHDLNKNTEFEVTESIMSYVSNEKYLPLVNYSGQNYEELIPIDNMVIIYGIPNELLSGDHIYNTIKNIENHSYESPAMMISIGFICLIAIIALVFPYSKVKNITLLKIPFEIWIIIIFIDMGIWIGAISSLLNYSINNIEMVISNITIPNNIVDLANIFVWFIIFVIAFFGVVELKSIFKIGFKEFFRTRSIIGRLILWCVRYVKKTVDYVTEIDLKEDNTKYILKLVLINAAILLILSSIWFVGYPLVIVYSIVLFVIAKKYVNDISEKYKRLTEATNEIAEGNLDVKIEEDLGVFNSFKGNLEKIQSGFKKAVDQEVKSQRMKTDLISNVSHDLKTPLTAIITYVDLLQDENISEEKREEYLQVVSKKSLRLQELIEDLFEMSKASSGNISLNIDEVDIVSLMKQTLLELDDKLKESSLIVRSNFPDEKVILPLDSQRTFRVFENLIINVAKYAMPNTRVYLDIIKYENSVEITIKNIAAEEIRFNSSEIVERFVRGDESRNTEGSGLGLAIAKSFVELQGGRFIVEVDGDLFKVRIVF